MTGPWADVDRFRQDIEFEATLRGQDFRFRSTWGLFSPREVDLGTALLLEEIEVDADTDCLDLGCGYGAIGLTLARLAPRGETWMLDKDFVAVEYAAANASANGVTNARALVSNGFSAVPEERAFDLVATNLPAKVGNELTTLLFADAYLHLRPGGRLYVVTLSGMRRFIQRTMEGLFGNYEKLRQGRVHTVHVSEKDALA